MSNFVEFELKDPPLVDSLEPNGRSGWDAQAPWYRMFGKRQFVKLAGVIMLRIDLVPLCFVKAMQ
jgi:hypothetical protein